MDDRERKIRDRAYALWERDGRPEGREREHWESAMQEVDAGAGGPADGGTSEARKGTKPTGARAKPAAAGEKKPPAAGARKPAAAKEKPGSTARKKKSDP